MFLCVSIASSLGSLTVAVRHSDLSSMMSTTNDDMKRFLVPQCKWDSKASPFGFWLFVGAIGAVVRTSTHWNGQLLEEFLDAKLKRAKVKKSSVPSYILEDPDFARPPDLTGRPSRIPSTR